MSSPGSLQAKKAEEEPTTSPPRKRSILEVSKQELQKNVEELRAKKLKTDTGKHEIPKDIAQLKSKSYDEIRTIFIEANVLDHEDISKMRLKGVHLYNAIQSYERNLQSKGTEKTAVQDMVAELISNRKVTDEDVAKSISNWLYNSYILRSSYTMLQPTVKIDWRDIASVSQFFKQNGLIIKKEKSILIDQFGRTFPLVVREFIIEQYAKFVISQIKSEGSLAKTNHPIPFCAAGPGSGKTRLNVDMMDCVCSFVKKDNQIDSTVKDLILNKSIGVTITFANGAPFEIDEDRYSVEVSILYRILFYCYSAFSKFIGDANGTFNLSKCVKVFEQHFTDNISLQYIVDLLKWDYGLQDSKILFYLGIDEFQKTSSLFLNNMLNYISKNMFIESWIFVPFITGTAYTRLDELIRDSTHLRLPFSFPLFSLSDLETIINALSETYPIFKKANFLTNDSLKFYLLKARQVPRVLEYVLK